MIQNVPSHTKKRPDSKKRRLVLLACAAVIAVVIALLCRSGGRSGDGADAYIQYIDALDYPEGHNDYPYLDYLRFALGYVDGDDIPELFLAYGDAHADQISVFTYDPSTRSVRQLGSYGSFGVCGYFARQDVIFGQVGGQGLWLDYYKNSAGSILAVEGSNARLEDHIEFYWISPYEDSGEEAFDFQKYAVTEDEWRENCYAFLGQYDSPVEIGYEDMTPYSAESLRAAWENVK